VIDAAHKASPIFDAVAGHNGPGATGCSYSDFPTILASISQRLGKLPAGTVVYTGHGDTTTIGGELVYYDEWVARGH